MKPDGFGDLPLMKNHPIRGHHQLVFTVVLPSDGTHYPSVKARNRFCDSKDVCILLLAVPGEDAGKIAVVDRIDHTLVHMADGPVHFHMDHLPQ